ncbi:MAG: GGDEF domain-containing protein, partial [Gallionella sp.]|nr:GGDEF domain-containing protein [Gallionella sp.]
NDTMGHLEGDKLLQSIAERLRSCMRESDTVSRQGGDEFVILLEDINDKKDVENIARKIMDAMRSPHRLGVQYKTMSFSIGAAIYPEDASDGVALMRCADQAMYRAKDAGRNNFKLYSEPV